MDFAAPHIGFVIAAYGLSFAGLAALALFVFRRDLKLRRQVAALERQRERRP